MRPSEPRRSWIITSQSARQTVVRRITAIAFGLMLTATPAISQQQTQRNALSGDKDSGSIGGMVVAAKTGESLRGTIVTLRLRGLESTEAPRSVSIETGLDGRYEFGGLPPGSYELRIQKSGYHSRSSVAHRVTLKQDQSVAGLIGKLWRPPVITGRVLDDSGEPLHDARVTAYRVRYRYGNAYLQRARCDSSNDEGEYRIFDLTAGKYIVRASRSEDQAPPGERRYRYEDRYYPDALDPVGAVPVKLDWGNEASGIDFRLAPAKETAVAGIAFDSVTGAACTNCSINLTRQGEDGFHGPDHSITVRGDGIFVFTGIARGSYRVTATTL